MQNVLVDQIYQMPAGSVFSAANFRDLAQRNTIDQTLLRLTKRGSIQKLATGLFCVPKHHHIIGNIPPSVDGMVQAYAHKFSYHIQISPAKAANILGLSQHVPAKHIYLTDGPNRSIVLGGVKITLKHVCPKKLIGINTKAGMVVQALYCFGNKGITDQIIAKIRRMLDNKDTKLLASWLGLMPGWMQAIVAKDILNA